MSLLKFKNYQATVTYDEGTLIIQVLHVDDFLTAECVSASETQKVFEDLINEYLEDCKQLGVRPNKPYKGSFNVRISPELHKTAATAAAEANLSLNSWVSEAIEEKGSRKDFGRDVMRERILTDVNFIGRVAHSQGTWKFHHDDSKSFSRIDEREQFLTMLRIRPLEGFQVN